MPPLQCPACGRFLAGSFVADLAATDEPCPRCERLLTAVPDGEGTVTVRLADEVAPGDEPPTWESAGQREDPSIRPPDLAPDQVGSSDPLADWDEPGGEVVELDRWRGQRQGVPDLTALAGATLFGAVLGALIGERRGRMVLFGAAVGLIGMAASRRIWELED